MELILISHPDFFKGETEIVSSLLDQYEFTYHLRKPDASNDELESFLKEIPDHLHNRIVVSNSIEILERFKLKGMHFSTSNREKRNHLSEKYYKGTSCHSIGEIRKLNDSYDYVYLSPIFPSISKMGYRGNLKMEEVSEFLNEKRTSKVYALGGINADRISELKSFDFDGFALLGSVWTDDPIKNQDEIENNLKKIHSLIR